MTQRSLLTDVKVWAVILLFSMAGMAQAKEKPLSARGVLEKYLALDADAAGLSQQSWPEFSRYTTWVTAPSWDGFTIISRYEVGRLMEGHTRAQATVTYYPIGKMTTTFAAQSKPESVLYHLNKVGNDWKVDSPQLPPHVDYNVMKRRLEKRSTDDPKAKPANDQLIAQIEAARQGGSR